MKIKGTFLAVGLALGLMSGTAKAATLNFNYVGSDAISFSLGNMPTPTSSGSYYTEFSNIASTLNGSATNLTFDFFDGGVFDGGFVAFNANYYLSTRGDQLFSGSNTNPMFSPGVFILAKDGGGVGTLTISSVPLPASAPMFGAALIAFGAVGYGVKRKKAAVAA